MPGQCAVARIFKRQITTMVRWVASAAEISRKTHVGSLVTKQAARAPRVLLPSSLFVRFLPVKHILTALKPSGCAPGEKRKAQRSLTLQVERQLRRRRARATDKNVSFAFARRHSLSRCSTRPDSTLATHVPQVPSRNCNRRRFPRQQRLEDGFIRAHLNGSAGAGEPYDEAATSRSRLCVGVDETLEMQRMDRRLLRRRLHRLHQAFRAAAIDMRMGESWPPGARGIIGAGALPAVEMKPGRKTFCI